MGAFIRLLAWLPILGAIALLGLLGFSLAGFLGQWCFLCDTTVHFRVQYFVLSVVLLAFFIWQKQRWAWLLCLFCLLLNLVQVLPWYWPKATALAVEQTPLRVMVSNIQSPDNRSPERFFQVLQQEQPDILIMLEMNRRWVDAMDAFTDQFPYALNQRDRTRRTDVAIYSRLPLKLLNPPALESMQKDVMVAQFERNGMTGLAIAMHPPSPVRRGRFALRNRVLYQVSNYVRQLQAEKVPGSDHIILGGDLNITMWSTFYQRSMQNSGLKNTRDGFGILPTWPTYLPPMLIPIDHCLVSPQIGVASVHTGKSTGADHLPYIADLLF